MIFGFNEIVEYVSKYFTLKTGDLIFTGTPSGVGSLIGMIILSLTWVISLFWIS